MNVRGGDVFEVTLVLTPVSSCHTARSQSITINGNVPHVLDTAQELSISYLMNIQPSSIYKLTPVIVLSAVYGRNSLSIYSLPTVVTMNYGKRLELVCKVTLQCVCVYMCVCVLA